MARKSKWAKRVEQLKNKTADKKETSSMFAKTWTNPRSGEMRVYVSGLFSSSDKLFFSEEKDGSVKINIKKDFGRADTMEEMMAGEAMGDILKEAGVDENFNSLINAIEARGGQISIA